MFDLTGKTAIVTGGAGGLGHYIALGLARQGADVVVTSRTLSKLEPVAKEIQSMGRKSSAVVSDITDPKSLEAMVSKVIEAYKHIDILVNVAGINARFSAEEFDPQEWEKVIHFNVYGTFLCCQAVGRVMIKQKSGKIINMSSVRGRNAPGVGGSAYATSKGGVDSLTRTLAVEWAKYNIQVNAIAPALVMTDMTREFLSQPETYKRMTAEIPQSRLGVPEDIIGPTVLLASKEADFMTGQIIYIDGGLSAR
jgi:NAD(P)-dependent dehydrogenase (short-subunit alcohol dehydrogenase family)